MLKSMQGTYSITLNCHETLTSLSVPIKREGIASRLTSAGRNAAAATEVYGYGHGIPTTVKYRGDTVHIGGCSYTPIYNY